MARLSFNLYNIRVPCLLDSSRKTGSHFLDSSFSTFGNQSGIQKDNSFSNARLNRYFSCGRAWRSGKGPSDRSSTVEPTCQDWKRKVRTNLAWVPRWKRRLKPERQAESLVRVAQEGFNLRDQLYTHQPYLFFFPAAGECWSLLLSFFSSAGTFLNCISGGPGEKKETHDFLHSPL